MGTTQFNHQGETTHLPGERNFGNAGAGSVVVDRPGRGSKAGGEPGDPNDPATWTIENVLQRLYQEGQISHREAVAAMTAFESGGFEAFKTSLEENSQLEKSAIDDLDLYVQLSPDQQVIEYGDYAGDVDSVGADAHADARSREAEYAALDKLAGLSDPSITPEEQFLMETARIDQERDMRAAREAVLRDQAGRGVRSGASETAAFLGSAGVTSQNRMLQDLGTAAAASERARLATVDHGRLAGDISKQTFRERFDTGSQDDYVAAGNKDRRTDYQREIARHRAEQQRDQFDIREAVTDKRVEQAGHEDDRAGSIAQGGYQIAQSKADIHQRPNQMTEALKLLLAQKEARRSEEMLKDKGGGGFFGSGVGPDIGPDLFG